MIFLLLFWEFFKIGLFTFGGGYAMIPMISQTIANNNWLDYETFYNMIAVSEATPGPFAVNIATYVGMETAGFFGALSATVGVVLPSFLIILAIFYLFKNFNKNIYVKNSLATVKPIVVGLIFFATCSIILKNLFNFSLSDMNINDFNADWIGIFIVAWLFVITRFKKINPIFIILISAILGLALYSLIEII